MKLGSDILKRRWSGDNLMLPVYQSVWSHQLTKDERAVKEVVEYKIYFYLAKLQRDGLEIRKIGYLLCQCRGFRRTVS